MNTQNLTSEDKKKIKYQLRPAIMILILFAAGLLIFNLVAKTGHLKPDNPVLKNLLYINIGAILTAVILSFLMARKNLMDLKDGSKKIIIERIVKKEKKTDYEAGSGRVNKHQSTKMKSFDSLNVIIDNKRYRVDEDFYVDCREGDEVAFHYTMKSNYCIKMELVKNKHVNKIF